MKYAGLIRSFVVRVLTACYTGVLNSTKRIADRLMEQKMCSCSVKFATKSRVVCYKSVHRSRLYPVLSSSTLQAN